MASAGLEPFSDVYAAIGWQPQQRRLLHLLTNATASASSGGLVDAAALAAAILDAANGSSRWTGGGLATSGAHNGSRHGSGGDGSGPVDISWLGLLLGALVIGVNGAISVWLRLGLHGKLAVATVRCA